MIDKKVNWGRMYMGLMLFLALQILFYYCLTLYFS